jgi:hypothetical protein
VTPTVGELLAGLGRRDARESRGMTPLAALRSWLNALAGRTNRRPDTRLELTETPEVPYSLDMNAMNPPPPAESTRSLCDVPELPRHRDFVIDDATWNPGSTSLASNDATVRPGRRSN